ncbi:MAG: leucine-rich repeat domain-containing protein [Ruminococcus sp.]|nr:leucine-rich repeat domain-containing protein [Ruminococcus sp.]
MIRSVLGIIAAIFLSITAVLDSFAAEYGCLEYSIINGEAVITGFSGEPTDLEIPEFISCYPVTEIRDNAFCNCSSLERITFPETLTKIGHHSFYACYSLREIALPSGLTELGEGCFCGCTALITAKLPDTLEQLPRSCFRACTSLMNIELPDKLESVGDFCFAGCTRLEKAETGECLASVGDGAFFMCNKLKSIYIPPSCTAIGDQAIGYSCDGNMALRQHDMLIRGNAGTSAERYAARNGLRFRAVNADKEKARTCALLLGIIILFVLMRWFLRIVFTDRSDQKLK